MSKSKLRIPLITILLCILLTVSVLATEGLNNFEDVLEYKPGQFEDVGEDDWFNEYVAKGYSLGLINGKSADTFEPDSNLSIAEALKLAAGLNSIYHESDTDFTGGTPWYMPYVDYCLENEIIDKEMNDYEQAATRAEFAVIFARVFPESAMEPINTVGDGDIPDVSLSDPWGEAVYLLYRSGMLTGSDAEGTFFPESNIKRSEVSAVLCRMADSEQRREVNLTSESDSLKEIADAALKGMDLINSMRPYIADGTITDSGVNKAVLELNRKLDGIAKTLKGSKSAAYRELGVTASLTVELTDSFTTKNAGYVTGTGLMLWNSCSGDYVELLSKLVEVSG